MDSKEVEIFKKYIPEKSVSYCIRLWQENRIQFTVSPPRKTVYGNYMYRDGSHFITVNGDLKPEAFLVTFLHEVAHLLVRKKFKRGIKPHGKEWQSHFRELMQPMLLENIFQAEVAKALWQHISAPKATSCADPILHKLLMQNDQDENISGFLIGEYGYKVVLAPCGKSAKPQSSNAFTVIFSTFFVL